MKITKIAFIQPANKVFDNYQLQGLVYPPMWALTLNSVIQKNFPTIDTTLYDFKIRSEKIEEAELFLFSGMNQDIQVLKDLREEVKSEYPNALCLLGGPIAWSFNEERNLSLLRDFDFVFVGDGEQEIINFISLCLQGKHKSLPPVIHSRGKFELKESIPLDFTILEKYRGDYSGGNIEVGRGCPFMCEFCDIRVMEDNNRLNNRCVESIIKDLEHYSDFGVNFIFMACDNFNTDVKWAEELCDEIIKWREKTGKGISFYTWCTINMCYHPTLLKKMRLAGFDTVFIGIESFHYNSLLETTKKQNVKLDLVDAVKSIQKYGFIVYAGLIMGFDSEDKEIAKIQLDGILNSGLISGDITPLIALPGTPLYKRLAQTGRLRDYYKSSLGYSRYSSNIKFNRSTEIMKNNFLNFFKGYNKGSYQRKRLINFYKCLNDDYIKVKNGDYASIFEVVKIIRRNPMMLQRNFLRLFLIFKSPERTLNLIIAFVATLYYGRAKGSLIPFFKFWLFAWTTVLLKSDGLKAEDIDIVGEDFEKIEFEECISC